MPGRVERRTRELLAKRAHFAAILPLAQPFTPDVEDLVSRMERAVEGSGARVLLHPEMRKIEAAEKGGGALSFLNKPTDTKMLFVVIDHVGIFIAARDGVMEHRGTLGAWANPEVWPEGPAEISKHRAWVEIADLGFMRDRGVEQLDSAFNRAAAVTAATAAVVEAASPLGVLWHPATNALSPQRFTDQFSRVIKGEAPVELWLRYITLKPEDMRDNEGVITNGLAPFTGCEIEVLPSSMSKDNARALAFDFARLVIDRGAVPRTGMVVNINRGFSATVRVGESAVHRGVNVYELTVEKRAVATAGDRT
ncbi:MAG: hypothetical protein AAFN17_17260 [Pseudomonadota bacterium]